MQAQAAPLRSGYEVIRRFRGGHTERWWPAKLSLFGYCPGRPVRAACAMTDQQSLSALSTGLPDHQRVCASGEIVRFYRLRIRVKQGCRTWLTSDYGACALLGVFNAGQGTSCYPRL